MKVLRTEEGFTLVELMVVVLIIGILVAIAVPVFLNASSNASAKSCQANQRTVVGAVQAYQADQNKTITVAAGGELLGADQTAVLFGPTANIRTIPLCPSHGTAAGVTGTLGDGQYHAAEGLGPIVDGDINGVGWFTAGHQLGH